MKNMRGSLAHLKGSILAVSLLAVGCQQGYSVKREPVVEAIAPSVERELPAPAPAPVAPVVVNPPVVVAPPVVVTPTLAPAPVVSQPTLPPVVVPAPAPVAPVLTPPLPIAQVPGIERRPLPPISVPDRLVAPPAPVVTAKPLQITESFDAASHGVKKLDFLFVVDNSGSMADNQRRLARGFRAFANTFYRRADLDICTMIITSDRYLGKMGDYEYERERRLPCTKPAGSQVWSADQMAKHVDSLISTFQEEIFVGTYGSGVELVGKSLVSFLFNQKEFGQVTNTENRSDFFRKDAVANITFLSDENNYFFQDPEAEESENDLPHVKGAAIPGSKTATSAQKFDSRLGIKDYLDMYFEALNPGKAASYSVTSFLDIYRSESSLPGISVSLNSLPSVVGRESKVANINGTADEYTEVYQSVADALVLRASEFKLAYRALGEVSVFLRRTSGESIRLAPGEFRIEDAQVIKLDPRVLPKLKVGDQVVVTYTLDVKGGK